MKETTVDHAAELVNRYVAIWNEPDPEQRRASVRELWTEDALHVFQPPQHVRDAAAALERRVARAYEKFVAPGEYSFRLRGEPARLGDVVKFNWEMAAADGQVAAVGLELLIIDPNGRARLDYQFIE